MILYLSYKMIRIENSSWEVLLTHSYLFFDTGGGEGEYDAASEDELSSSCSSLLSEGDSSDPETTDSSSSSSPLLLTSSDTELPSSLAELSVSSSSLPFEDSSPSFDRGDSCSINCEDSLFLDGWTLE